MDGQDGRELSITDHVSIQRVDVTVRYLKPWLCFEKMKGMLESSSISVPYRLHYHLVNDNMDLRSQCKTI